MTQYCDDCGVPVFGGKRYANRILCPICYKDAKEEEREERKDREKDIENEYKTGHYITSSYY